MVLKINKPNSRAIWERIIDGIYTKGTYIDPSIGSLTLSKDSDINQKSIIQAKNILCFTYDEENESFGITYFDLTTLEFWVGEFQDDSLKTKFRTLWMKTWPVEVICESKLKTSILWKMLKLNPVRPAFFYFSSKYQCDLRDSIALVEHYLDPSDNKNQNCIRKMIENSNSNKLSIISLGYTVRYLEDMLIADKTLPIATFYKYTHEGIIDGDKLLKQQTMTLDAQALTHLDIFEVDSIFGKKEEGSLFHFLNRCSTAFGSRLLRKWLWSPLLWEDKLTERHESVEFLVKNYKICQLFNKEIKGTMDLERWLSRWYKHGVESESRALYVTVNLTHRLNYFFTLLNELEKLVEKIEKVFKDNKILPKRLKELTTFSKSIKNQNINAAKIKKN